METDFPLTPMKPETQILRELVTGMRAAYARGENAMTYARTVAGASRNSTVATLVAYDLQAGSYVAAVRQNPAYAVRWCAQLAGILRGYTTPGGSLLEVGCGEATTLAGVLRLLPATRGAATASISVGRAVPSVSNGWTQREPQPGCSSATCSRFRWPTKAST